MSKYDSLSKEKLIAEIKQLKKTTYGLIWDDKPEDVAELCRTKLPVLVEAEDKEISTKKNGSANILIEGDNYHALAVLSYTHGKKIDAIYIDPPYNTGARDWKYNNAFVDAQDPYRHSKWLSFMEKRLKLAKDLLANDGIICVTIDDNEMPRLWCLMDKIFGENNHLGTVAIRINPGGRKSKRKIAAQHEYALFYSRTSTTKVAQVLKTPTDKSHSYKQDNNGEWYEERNLRKEGADSLAKASSKRYYPIYFDSKTGKLSTKKKYKIEIWPIDTDDQNRIWRRDKNAIDDLSRKGDIYTKKTKYGLQVYFKFKGGLKGETPKSFWDNVKFSASEHGTQILDKILGKREAFPFPKSPYAVMECIQVCSSRKDATILDFFAGSGTTGQAVLMLNKIDKGQRSFILCTNNENKIAEDVCYPRISRVIKGHKDYKDITGFPTSLKYFRTDFVDADPTDKNKKKLTEQATEMLCLKEGTFEKVVNKKAFKIYKNTNNYTGIIFDQMAIPEFKEVIAKMKSRFSVYVFSLGDDSFDDEFDDVKQKVKISPIPEVILRVYRRIFK